jgi:hypothetical protein
MLELRHGTWVLLAASLVVGLAALVRMADPAGSGGDGIVGVIRLSSVVTWTILSLFGLAATILAVDVARRMRSKRQGDEDARGVKREEAKRPPWQQALSQILSVVNFAVVVYLLWRNVLPLADLMAIGQGGGAAGDAVAPAPDAPSLITWTFTALALLAGVGAVGLAVWLTSSERLASWWAREDDEPAYPPLVEAVDESLDDLRDEPDARRAIIQSYARFERAAGASGLRRRPWQTPMEFMRDALTHLAAPRGAVRALTALFEVARFSDHPLGSAERDEAFTALHEIRAAFDTERRDAAAH